MAAWLESGAALGSLGLDLAGVGVHGEEVARRSDPCGCVYDGFVIERCIYLTKYISLYLFTILGWWW